MRWGVALAAAVLAAAVFAGTGSAAAAACNERAVLPLDVTSAAAVETGTASGTAAVGSAAATKLAKTLRTGGGDVCTAPATAATRARLAAITALYARGNRVQAHAQLVALLNLIASRRVLASAEARRRASASGCGATKVGVDTRKAGKVGDYLKAAAAAQQAHDEAASSQALADARQAFSDWAAHDSGATTAGDHVALAAQALKLGDAATAQAELDKAQTAATKQIADSAKVDPCTATVKDLNCFVSANMVGQLVGASETVDPVQSGAITDAISARLQHQIPPGCEEWSFTMKLTDDQTGWGIVWGTGNFRVNRKTGVLEGSQAAGLGPGWPGIIGNWAGTCDVDGAPVGPASFTGGPFHYALSGTVDDQGFHLQVESADANVNVSVPPDLGCQFLGAIADLTLDAFVKGPFPIDFPVGPADTTYTWDDAQNGAHFTATVTKVSSGS